MKKSVYEIALELECLAVGVKCERYESADITDKRVRDIIALAKNDLFHESLCVLCRDIAQGYCKIDGTSVNNYDPLYHVQSGDIWRWFRRYPNAVQLVERAIGQHLTPEIQQEFKLERFVLIALDQEYAKVCQAVKNYILEAYEEQ